MNERIKELAEQAGFNDFPNDVNGVWITDGYWEEELERFAELVAEQTHTNNKAKWYQEGYEAGQREEREQAERKPVKSYTGGVPQYATDAPKRPWVGLMDEEILLVNGNEDYSTIAAPDAELIEFTRAIEAKLKEKNV
jgi:hypothetical protein